MFLARLLLLLQHSLDILAAISLITMHQQHGRLLLLLMRLRLHDSVLSVGQIWLLGLTFVPNAATKLDFPFSLLLCCHGTMVLRSTDF